MKRILLAGLLLTGSVSAQTAIIAHKSHSGTAATFAFADPGNFGLPPTRLVRVTKVSDTSVIMTNSRGGSERNDTIYYHPVFSDPNITVDSMQKLYYDEVEFKGFDKKPSKEKTKAKSASNETEHLKTVPESGEKAVVKERRKKKKGSLVWLWTIGGGTFTAILLLSRKRNKATIGYA